MTFTLTIDTDTAAFGDTDEERREELANQLRNVVDRITHTDDTTGRIRDENGNTVGTFDTDGATPRGALTIRDAVTLGHVISWCQRTARLSWLDDRDNLFTGTARSIGDERGNFLRSTDDVRDAFVRITTSAGWEWFVPMVDVIARAQAGTMVRDT